MKIAIHGTGNVGWLLSSIIAQQPYVDSVLVCSKTPERVAALCLDVASADPLAASKISFSKACDLIGVDIIVLASAAQCTVGQSMGEQYLQNVNVIDAFLESANPTESVITIVVTSPVYKLTPYVQNKKGLCKSRIIGFGGDLDRNRLRTILLRRGIDDESATAIGEHGTNAIPVYWPPNDYKDVARQLRGFLGRIMELAGPPRNVASSFLLSRLIKSIALDTHDIHSVCGYHPKYRRFVTWPFRIGRSGVVSVVPVDLAGEAKEDFMALQK